MGTSGLGFAAESTQRLADAVDEGAVLEAAAGVLAELDYAMHPGEPAAAAYRFGVDDLIKRLSALRANNSQPGD